MVEILVDSFKDIIKVVPLMFLIFLAVDGLMLKLDRNKEYLTKLARLDVVGGGILGIIPQCGVSVAFARLYANGYITLGMLVAVFVSSSDEALIIIGAHPDRVGLVLYVILIKLVVAVIAGYIINFVYKEKRNRLKGCNIDCNCPRCRNDKRIFRSSLIHTLKITVYLFITVFLINLGLDKLGEEHFHDILGKNTILQPVFAAVTGMIPSCFSSVFIAESYLKGAIGFGALIAGLGANTGYGILIVLKELPLKKGLKIIALLLAISILAGEIFVVVGGRSGGL